MDAPESDTAILPPAWAARLWFGSSERLLYAGQTLRLGRGVENDLVFDDPTISRAHALLEWNGTGFTLRDLGSVNGTYVNDQRLAAGARLLRDGDQLNLGRVALRYEIARATAPQEPASPVPPAQPPAAVDEAVTGPLHAIPTEPLSADCSPCLLVTLGPDLGQEYPLWGELITIGRASREATWEIRLTDRSVSRPHARLELRTAGYVLYDLDSANGTTLNGAPLTGEAQLSPGDVIGVGETNLVFRAR